MGERQLGLLFVDCEGRRQLGYIPSVLIGEASGSAYNDS